MLDGLLLYSQLQERKDECWCFRLPPERWSLLVSHTFITIFSSEILSLRDDVIMFTTEAPKAQTGHETPRAAETLYRSFKVFEVQRVLNILEELRYRIKYISSKLTEQKTKTLSCYQSCWHPDQSWSICWSGCVEEFPSLETEAGTSTYLWPHSVNTNLYVRRVPWWLPVYLTTHLQTSDQLSPDVYLACADSRLVSYTQEETFSPEHGDASLPVNDCNQRVSLWGRRGRIIWVPACLECLAVGGLTPRYPAELPESLTDHLKLSSKVCADLIKTWGDTGSLHPPNTTEEEF